MEFPLALANLETAVLDACAGEEEWPAQIVSGICAGIDFAIAHPQLAETLAFDSLPGAGTLRRYESAIGLLTGLLREKAPVAARLPGYSDEALVGGLVGIVGDHLRIGRLDRLKELRPELVLLTLLPYIGFEEAQQWANKVAK